MRFPAAGSLGQRRFDMRFVVAERLQRFANLPFGVAMQPAQPGFFRGGLIGEAVELQISQHIVADRSVHAFDHDGELAVVLAGFGDHDRLGFFLPLGDVGAADQGAEQQEVKEARTGSEHGVVMGQHVERG